MPYIISALLLSFSFQKSNATIDFSKNIDIKRNHYVNATVRIENATDFISTIEIRGTPGFKFDVDQMDWLFDSNKFKPRSYALICTEQKVNYLHQKRRIFEFGSRVAGDFLINFQNEFVSVKNSNKFTFDFKDSQINITYLALDSYVSNQLLIEHN